MERKVRRYDAARRKHEAERRTAWSRVDELWAERNAERNQRQKAEAVEAIVRRQRDLLVAEHAALCAALGIGLNPLNIAITWAAFDQIAPDWRIIIRAELRRRFEDQMRQIFAAAVVPLIDQARSVADLDRLLGDRGRIDIALGNRIVRAGEEH